MGVTYDKYVVFYDNISGMSAARGVWLLLYFSHKKVSLLDGGYGKWIEEGYPQGIKTIPFNHSNFMGRADRRVLACSIDVQKAIGNRRSAIIDARTKEEYDGKHVRAAKAGHIPYAINVDWQHNLNGGRYKNIKELSKIYSGILHKSEVITYCQGGYRAAHTFVALKHLGYENVRMYLGSWGEWGNKHNLPAKR
jgi:thiosulfate/3-mercaptopyruvate sulfurtransferase